jgi:hypothetical protein
VSAAARRRPAPGGLRRLVLERAVARRGLVDPGRPRVAR